MVSFIEWSNLSNIFQLFFLFFSPNKQIITLTIFFFTQQISKKFIWKLLFHLELQNMQEILFSWLFFEGRPGQGKKILPDWLCYLAGCSKSRHCIGIQFLVYFCSFLMKTGNTVKYWKELFWYSQGIAKTSKFAYLHEKANIIIVL